MSYGKKTRDYRENEAVEPCFAEGELSMRGRQRRLFCRCFHQGGCRFLRAIRYPR